MTNKEEQKETFGLQAIWREIEVFKLILLFFLKKSFLSWFALIATVSSFPAQDKGVLPFYMCVDVRSKREQKQNKTKTLIKNKK